VCVITKYLSVTAFPPKKNPEQDGLGRSSLEVGLKEIWEIMLKIGFDFPGCFFFRVMVPLNLVHFDGFPPSASLVGV
jgi:hypothetical protein